MPIQHTCTLVTRTPVCVGEVHAQQDALLFTGQGGDDNEIPDSVRVDGLELHSLRSRAWKRGATGEGQKDKST